MSPTEKYSLTDEHRAQLGPWAAKWIANAMSTKPMDAEDRSAMVEAIYGLYEAATLPRPLNIVFVPSPFCARFAGGFAAAAWELRKQGSAIAPANGVGLTAATLAAISESPTVTTVSTAGAAYAPDPNPQNWYSYPVAVTDAAKALLGDQWKFGLECANLAWRMWQGGNHWSPYDSFLSFFRHVVKLPIDYSKYAHWESAAIHGGPRIMHEKFCIVSYRPRRLTVDAENRPHCEDGPFCLWSDGSALYAHHGVRVPGWVLLRPELLTVAKIDAEQNAEVRRVMLEKYGEGRYIEESGVKMIHEDELGQLYRKELPDDEPLVMVRVRNSTPEPDGSHRPFWLRVDPQIRPMKRGEKGERIFRDPQQPLARNAVASTYFMTGDEYVQYLVKQS